MDAFTQDKFNWLTDWLIDWLIDWLCGVLTLYLIWPFWTLPIQQQKKIGCQKYGQVGIELTDWVENRYEQFLLFPQCFQKLFVVDATKWVSMEERVNSVSTLFHLDRVGQGTYPCFPGIPFTCSPHITLPKLPATFPHNHCRNNGQRWERNESCRNDYYQPSERILAEPGIEPATSCPQVATLPAEHSLGLERCLLY